ncbi:MAG TPA: cytochrome c biogenesis protein ResB [Elusimicrobiota bacterium]|nr:cytochrome c biogenesis protein ResB [Elusimicrobiota bacterium]
MTFNKWLDRLASVRLTLVCLGLMMVLVVFGTLAQVDLGTFAAQQRYFNTFIVFRDVGDWSAPFLPGGLTVGGLWLVNLVAAFIKRFRWKRSEAGIYISHAGLILLLIGQFLAQTLAKESEMPIRVGQSLNYTESPRETELVLTKISDPDLDEVTSIPYSLFSREGEIRPPRLPFAIVVRRFMPNAQLGMAGPGARTLATQGIGTRVQAEEIPPTASDEESNNVSAFVEIRAGGRSLGVWLVSSGLGAPQSFFAGGGEYRIAIRPRRTYLPYTLTLKEFRHDVYPGTDIPKNFSSLVHLSHPEKHESRDALIYMNHPLRYAGRTFYQESFGEGDRLSVLQVVDNPASSAPYVSCALIVLGLAIQFLSHLVGFARSRA